MSREAWIKILDKPCDDCGKPNDGGNDALCVDCYEAAGEELRGCDACGSDHLVEVGTLGNNTILRCRHCGSILYREVDNEG